MTPELRALLQAQRAATEALQKKLDRIIPQVFHRRGRPLKTFYKAWPHGMSRCGLATAIEEVKNGRRRIVKIEAHRIPTT